MMPYGVNIKKRISILAVRMSTMYFSLRNLMCFKLIRGAYCLRNRI